MDVGLKVKDVVKQHWGNRAATFDERPNHGIHDESQRRAWLEVLSNFVGTAPLRVLDLGCGTGFLSLLLAELGHDVTGIDVAPEMLQLARQKSTAARLDVEWRLGDAESLTDADDSYDLIVARHVIWTLPNPGPAVQEWRRVLRSRGRVGLVEGHFRSSGPSPMQADYEPIYEYLPFYGGASAEELAAFLTDQGLEEVSIEPLMDAALWGGEQQRERYLASGRNP